MNNIHVLLTAVLLAATGCAGRYPRPDTAKSGAAANTNAVAAAGLPYRVLLGKGGRELSDDELLAQLGRAQAICIGETHPNPHDHWAQLTLLQRITATRRGPTALGMEMFQRPFQGVLDDYGSGRIDEDALLVRSDWASRWGFDFALYRPMVELARDRGLTLLALNAPRELTKKVARRGVGGLSDGERAQLPEMVLDDAEHRAWWDDIMGGIEHGHGPHGSERSGDSIYAAQVLWDETMAETAARWLTDQPGGLVVILAGNGHCHDLAIVRRLQRRGIERAVSVLPIVDDGQGNVAAELAAPLHDYLFVMSRGDESLGSRD